MTLDERAPIDPNTADQETLGRLPGVGPVLADRMIAARPFETLADLTRVSGIGAASVERWAPWLALPSADPEPGPGRVEDDESEQEIPSGGAPDADATQDVQGEDVDVEDVDVKRLEVRVEPDAAPQPPDAPPSEAGEGEPERFTPLPAGEPPAEEEELEPFALLPLEEPPAEEAEPEPAASAPAEEAEREPSAPAPEEEPSAEEVEPELAAPAPAEEPPARGRPAVTRRYVGCLVVASGVLALALSLVLSLGVLARLNNYQLQFASPAQVNALELRVEGLEAQAEGLARDVEGLRTRLSAVEAIGERTRALEGTAETLRSDLDATGKRLGAAEGAAEALQADAKAAATRVAELSAQVEAVGADVETLQAESGRFQTFLDGLQALMDSLFNSQGGQ